MSRHGSMDEVVASVDLAEIVYVLRCARDGWPLEHADWDGQAVAAAAWNGFLASGGAGDKVSLTPVGSAFLEKTGLLYPEARFYRPPGAPPVVDSPSLD